MASGEVAIANRVCLYAEHIGRYAEHIDLEGAAIAISQSTTM